LSGRPYKRLADLGETPPPSLTLGKKTEKTSQKEEKAAGQAKQAPPPSPALAQGLDPPLEHMNNSAV